MRTPILLLTLVVLAVGCGKAGEPPPITQDKPVVAAAPSPSTTPPAAPSASVSTSASVTATAPAPIPIEKLSTTTSTTGWKKLETKLGFSLEFPDKIFTTTTNATGVSLTSKLVVDAPHGIIEKGVKTEHRFSARLELRKEDVVTAMKRLVPYAGETAFPKGTVASFTPSAEFVFKTDVGGHEAYVVLWGAHGYGKRSYFVVVDAGKTLTIDFNVITDYLAHLMPKSAKMTEQEQMDTADAVVLSLKL